MNRLIGILNKCKDYLLRTRYLKYFKNDLLDEYSVLLECQHGKNINGNVFYLIKELCTNKKYSKYKCYISVDKNNRDKITTILKKYDITNYKLVEMKSISYYKALSTSKYLINDTSFLPFFIKKRGQVYLNTWHGTPLKTLGKKDNGGYHAIGNIQKNFIVADYLLYPSEYMMNHMVEDYMLENLSDAKCVINGYPRNSVFFNKPNEEIIEKLNAQDKQIIGYMPTWRGTVGNVKSNEETKQVMEYLSCVDEQLSDNQLMLVNLHPFVSDGVDYKAFKHIKHFPEGYETYEVLNVCDTLITDYSSVFFDYASKKKKVILFAYDEEEYLRDRGLYIPFDSLPFPRVDNIKDLIEEINTPINYSDEEFLKEFCPKENVNASEQLLDLVLFNNAENTEIREIKKNGKENILIYGGNLAKNGITTALMNLLNHIDLEEYNYYISYPTLKVAEHKEILKNLPEKVGYIPMSGSINSSLIGIVHLAMLVISKKIHMKYNVNNKVLKQLYMLEKKRIYGDVTFKHVIHFTGYEMQKQLLYGNFDCERTIFVHNNMIEEVKTKGNTNPNALRYAYNHYDQVAIVTEDMREPTRTFCFNEDKMKVVNNLIDYKKIIRLSKEDTSLDETTLSNKTLEEVNAILESENKVFVTIGRFSNEKGHLRLLDSFNRLWIEDNSIYLMIIGGYGPMYKQTLEYADNLECGKHVIIIRALSNPYAFLKQCDYLVLSSFYEAFGLVLVEADILGVPVMSTDILGPRGFMKEHNGLLVANDEEGIYGGMKLMLDGKVKPLGVDYEQYNQQAIHQFKTMMK